MNATEVATKAGDMGRRAHDSSAFDQAVKLGLVSYGVVHLIIAGIAVQLATGDRSGEASGSGALNQLAQQPFGEAAMWVLATGFAALVVWQLVDAAVGHRSEEGARRVAKRAGSLFKVVVYGVLGFSALKLALGNGASSDDTDTLTARLLSMPGGQVLVGLVGLGVLAYAGHHVWRGFSGSFMDRLKVDGHVGVGGAVFETFGRFGYVAKGAAFLPVAALFFWAAGSHDANKSGGLDQALQQVLRQPFGSPVLFVIALGIAAYGLFCFAWARHLDR